MTPAIKALEQAGALFTVHEYDHDPDSQAYGQEAVDKLGVPGSQVFKTLVAEIDGNAVVAIVPVDRQLDLKALARAGGGKKAVLADPATAVRRTGYLLGAVSPFGQKQRLRTLVDDSAARLPSVYVSAGRRGLEVEVTPAVLETVVAAEFLPISRA